ncbi:MAG: Domain often clustered or fused with uracil-DNA glycosylase / Uracil-DNA glycosylase, putative family 6 [uncultured Acetobacteraceae bacterium]|uniref:Type-4 uracil-DNA glycosylase n=1 Tax=uncultured Acetobacteraceae bacterium TaxID=169975 RepID=A0A6J4J707_9PROT|nr:MAG: Domain often clustered or fused with uracil-DNA glycosylase / Uracil-DNA glycosylase, putative family 6 [uncultured Acetobacteraceae bacterium]
MQAIGVLLNGPADFAGWRDQARRLLAAEVPPEAVEWRVPGEAPGLFATGAVPDAPTVPRAPGHLSERSTAAENPKTSAPDASTERAPAVPRAPWHLSERPTAAEKPATSAVSTISYATAGSAPTVPHASEDLSERFIAGERPGDAAASTVPHATTGSAPAAPHASMGLSERRVNGEGLGDSTAGIVSGTVAGICLALAVPGAFADLFELRGAGERPEEFSGAVRPAPAARRATEELSERCMAGETPRTPAADANRSAPTVPRAFVRLSETAIRHRDPERFALLYRALWRLTHGEPALMRVATDPDVVRLEAMAKAVRRDAHKMHAFVRFREIRTADGPRFVSWFEPEHHILEAEAGFFVRRFAGMRWSILTPTASAHWDGATLTMGPGARRADAPAEDAQEDLWRAYYASIFNPARLKPGAMRAEMPVKYWRNLPEARLIPRLIADAPRRAAAMVERGASAPALWRQRNVHWGRQPVVASDVTEAMPADLFTAAVDPAEGLAALRAEMLALNSLPAWTADATQMVFGEGPVGAPLVFVGEQPGDEEDIAGRPFVGPAGRMFNKAMEEAGIPRNEAYVTNAVKHFKFKPTGRRRLHQSPDAGDITYYRPFLKREIDLVGPQLVVTLGATALRALSGKPLAINKTRGEVIPMADGPPIFPTVHPSYLLRLPDPDSKAREYERFVADLKRAHREVA